MYVRMLAILIIFSLAQAASVPALWSGSSLFQSTTYPIISTALKAGSLTATFSTAYSSLPKILPAIPNLSANPGTILEFDVYLTSASATGITINYTVGATTTITMLQLSVMSMPNTALTSFVSINRDFGLTFPTVASSTGDRVGVTIFNFTMISGQTMNTSHVIKVILFIQGIKMQANSGATFNVTLEGNFLNSNDYAFVISTSGTTTIARIRGSRFLFDQTLLQATQTTFVDAGHTTAKASTWSQLTLTFPWMTPSNFITGFSSIACSTSSAIDFAFDPATLTYSGSLVFDTLAFGYWNYRVRSCPTGYPLFSSVTNLCYDACDPYFYYTASSQACLPCFYSCYTCSNTSNTRICLSCSALDHRTLIGTSCVCMPGYSDVGVALCAACNYTCATCTNSTGCKTCNSSNFRTLTSGQCPCNVGYVNNGTAMCVPCSSFLVGCISCTTTTTCTTCKSSAKFSLNGSICSCQSGNYLSGTSCLSCSILPGCLMCSSASICTSCNVTLKYVLTAGACVCATGTYLSAGTCLNCPVGCTACTSSTVCTSCSSSLTLSSGICACITGQYLSAGACLSCSNTLIGCLACSSSSICTVCDTASNFTLSGTTCVCHAGFYQSGGACISCSSSCLACSASSCSSCSSPYTVDSAGACSCSSGTIYNLGSNSCTAVSLPCGAGKFSTSVWNGFAWVPGCANCVSNCYYCDVTACYACNTGFYLSASSNCPACPQGCAACLNPSTCTACLTNYQLNGVCICPSGFAINFSGNCVACSTTLPGCLTCSNTATCTVCDTISNFITDPSNSSRCVCADGFYLSSGGDCLPCSIVSVGCDTCSSSAVCTSCNSLTFFTLSGNTCACISGHYLSGSVCNQCPVGCTKCGSSGGTVCTACDTVAGFTLSGTTCVCSAGMFLPASGSTCLPCTNTFWACSVCTIATCTGCISPATILSAACICPTGFYNDTVACQSCPTQIAGCVTCVLGSCLTCDATLLFQAVPVSGECVCQTGLILDGSSCVTCAVAMPGCTDCLDAVTCTACDTTLFFVLNGSQCQCTVGYFLNSTGNCQLCSTAIVGCAECTDGLTCTSCPLPLMILLPNSICGCQPTFVLSGAVCVSCMISCVCYGFQLNASNVCTTVCSDGITIDPSEQCDDGNLLPGDGCSATCTIQAGFYCTLDVDLLSTCFRNDPMKITLVSTIKNATSNTVVFTFSLSPAPALLGSLDFSQAITTNLSGSSNVSYSYDGNGVLTLTAQYNSSIQGQNMTLNFNPATIGGAFMALSPSNVSFVVNPNNNLPAIYNDDSTYNGVEIMNSLSYVIVYGSLAAFLVSLFLAKFIGIELMGVVQVAFIGLMTIIDLPPLLASMTNLVMANGYNQAFDKNQFQAINQTMPYPVTSLSYLAPMVYSFNYTLLLVLLPILAWLGLFIASKTTKNENKRSKLVRWSWLALGQWGFTAILFVLYHSVVCVMLFALYDGEIQPTMLGLSVADALFVFGLAAASLVFFKLRPQYHGDYRKAFNADTLSQYHYYLIVASRLILAAAIVAANPFEYVGFVCLIVPFSCCIYVAVKRPYKLLYNNIRAIINEIIMVAILGIYGYLRAFEDTTSQCNMAMTVLPWVEIILLLGCLVMNSVFIGKYWWDSRHPKPEAKQEVKADVKQTQPDSGRALEMTGQRLTSLSQALFNKGRVLESPQPLRLAEQMDLKIQIPETPFSSPKRRIKLEQKLLAKKKPIRMETTMAEHELQDIEQQFDEL